MSIPVATVFLTCGDMSLCWLCESWKAGLICTAGLTASAGVMPRCCLSCQGTYPCLIRTQERDLILA